MSTRSCNHDPSGWLWSLRGLFCGRCESQLLAVREDTSASSREAAAIARGVGVLADGLKQVEDRLSALERRRRTAKARKWLTLPDGDLETAMRVIVNAYRAGVLRAEAEVVALIEDALERFTASGREWPEAGANLPEIGLEDVS